MSFFIETSWGSKLKWGEELCGDKVELVKKPEGVLLVLSDGLGSGVKANILAGLTSKIISTMVSAGTDMKDVVETAVNSITTTETQHLYLDGVEADKIRGKNICLLDDVISTGESMQAMETLVQQAGANVVARAAVLAEGEAADRKDIIFLKKLPLFHVDEQGHHTEIE